MTGENITALTDYEQHRNGAEPYPPVPADRLVKQASNVSSRVIKWAWKGRLALGYITVQTGEEGLGKSVFDAWLVARVSHGELEGVWHGSPVDVLVVAGEDGLQDTWIPRLKLAGADLERVHFLSLDELSPDWNVRDGIEALRQALAVSNAQLVVFDALLDHMPAAHGGENINSPTFVRTTLTPLRDLLKELRRVGIISMHPPKSRGASFRDLVQASQAFAAIPRIGLYFGWHPDDAEDDPNRRRVVVRGKGNIGRNPGALEFRVAGRDLLHDDGEWQEREMVMDVLPSDVTLHRLLARPRPGQGEDEPPNKARQAAEIMRAELADGDWHPGSPIRDILHTRWLNHNQTVADAKELAGVETRQSHGAPHGGWEWRIPKRSDPRSGQSQGQGQRLSAMTLTPETARIPNTHGQSHQNQDIGTADSDGRTPQSDCAKHPSAGRWRLATSDYWMCEGCHPRSEGVSGVVVEPATCSDSGAWGDAPPEVPPDALSPPGRNGREPVATLEQEALLVRATQLMGDGP